MAGSLSRRIRAPLPMRFIVLAFVVCVVNVFRVPTLRAQSVERAVVLTVTAGKARFDARATFGAFNGRTTAVAGAVSSPRGPLQATGWVEVTLDSLQTGQGMRDRHMRDALETSQFPTARFELDSLRLSNGSGSEASSGTVPMAVRLHGRFRVHGVWRPVIASGTVRETSSRSWQLAASFPVTLSDHKISKGLTRGLGTIRVAQEITVTIEAEFSER